jgi:uncharacterized integral membrane protein (TIGR00698 family)
MLNDSNGKGTAGLETSDRHGAGNGRKNAQRICLAAIGIGLVIWGTPPVALFAGIVTALTIGLPPGAWASKFSKHLLQICVVFLGFSMDLPTVLRAGWNGAAFSAVSIGGCLFAGYWIGRWLGVNRAASTLISAGTAICGGSAIAAVSSVIIASEGEIAVAIGTVFVLNAIALYLFPIIGHALALTQGQFGVWAGVAIHDVSSVVGAGLTYGQEALSTAVSVKLARTLWIIPVTLGIRWAMTRRAESESPLPTHVAPKKGAAVPWFIGAFLAASLARSYAPVIADWSHGISQVARAGFTAVLFLIGGSLKPQVLKTMGWRAFTQGAILWLLVAGGSLALIMAQARLKT